MDSYPANETYFVAEGLFHLEIKTRTGLTRFLVHLATDLANRSLRLPKILLRGALPNKVSVLFLA
jgi:hypothetical protein